MIGVKLKELRETTGMNKKEFAQYLGLKYTTYNGYETEAREPSSDFLILVSEKFNVSIDYLLGLKNESEILHSYQLRADEFNYIKKYRDLDLLGREHIQTILDWETNRVSTLNNQKTQTEDLYTLDFPTVDIEQPTRTLNYYQRLASAGTGQIVFDDVPVDLIEIPDIPEYNRVKYAIGVNGDSMEPLYYDGDILLVEPMPDVRIDDIGIFIVDGESLVKKRGKKSLISLNKKKNYPEIPFTEETRCLGRVVDKISTPDSAYSKLESEDLDALEKGMDLLFSQSFGSKKEAIEDSEIGEFMDKTKTVLHPDISALDPDDITALENGQIKMFKHGKKA